MFSLIRQTVVISAFVLAVVANPAVADQQTVTFAGSSTVMPLMEEVQDLLLKGGIEAHIQGGGSSAGVRSVRMGMAEVGMLSRGLTSEEQEDLHSYTLAKDIIVLITNRDNPIQGISREAVRAIYGGERTHWDNGNRITVIAKESGRATKFVFDRYFDLLGRVRRDAVIIGANGQAIAAVARDQGALAYVSYSAARFAIADGEPIRILPLDGIEPSVEVAASGDYPLSRDLILVVRPEHEGLLARLGEILRTPGVIRRLRAGFVVPTER